MSRTLLPARPVIDRVLRQLARIVVNVGLAYMWGGLWAFLAIAMAERLDPTVTGVFGLVGSWVWTMYWLFVGLPFVVGTLAILDLALYRAADRRLVGLVVSLLPGALATVLTIAEPALLGIALWHVATGVGFGLTMRVPPPTRSNTGWH